LFFFTILLVIKSKVYIFADLFGEGLLFYAEKRSESIVFKAKINLRR